MNAPGAKRNAVRLFFALWPQEPVRSTLAAAAAAAAVPLAGARVVPSENYHLTVAFVGEVPADSLERVRLIGRESRASVFAINFDAYEYWPKPEVVVAATRAIAPALQALWAELHQALADDGFELRVKKLRPHVTLAHRVAEAPQLPPLRPFTWPARELCLLRSDTGTTGPVYTVVDTWSLLDKPARD
jgi:RNA 2',3'-cyclic 3'-phosphodiesterase